MAKRVQHTLYQVSTATALVEGIYQGAVQIAALREHGDLGLGTFESLDGEMVVVDGHFYQVRSDGSVREVQDNVLSPFAAVTAFSPDQSITLENCPFVLYFSHRAVRAHLKEVPVDDGQFTIQTLKGTSAQITVLP